MAAPRSIPIFFAACALLLLLSFAVVVSGDGDQQTRTTCVPSLQRLLSCLDFIEHRTEEIPVRATVADKPCCLMHVMRGHVARLMGPGYDNARAMVNVTAACLADASVLVDITRNCSGS
nr:unnamed protein product [Digitaria exilis]